MFSTSDTGTLVYQTGGTSGGWQMQWVGRDGKQFLLNGTISHEGDAPLNLVTNWFAKIKK